MTFSPDAAARPDSGIFGLDTPPADAKVILVPVPFDATASYGRRTAAAPAAILRASHQVDLLDRETGRPYEAGIAMLPEHTPVARWNDEARAVADACRHSPPGPERDARVQAVTRRSEAVNEWLRDEADRWLGEGRVVGVVGGDHSAPFGLIDALSRRTGGLGVLHVDAHADLREAYEGFAWSHASIMHNVLARTSAARLVQVGVRDFGEAELAAIEGSRGRVTTFFDQDLADELARGTPLAALAARIVDALPREVYVSFDIDGLDPALCPHTGTPVPGGLSFRDACVLLKAVTSSGRRIVGFDLCEVGPAEDEWDANVGARVLYKLIGHALSAA